MKGTLDIHRLLLGTGVAHEVRRLPRIALAADEVPDLLGLPAQQCLAVRVYALTGAPAGTALGEAAAAETAAAVASGRASAGEVVATAPKADVRSFVAVLVRAGEYPDTDALLRVTGAQCLVRAGAEQTSAATDYWAGLVSPFLLPPEVPLLIDTAVADQDVVYTPTGEGGLVLAIRLADLLAVTGGTVTRVVRSAPELVPVPAPLVTTRPRPKKVAVQPTSRTA